MNQKLLKNFYLKEAKFKADKKIHKEAMVVMRRELHCQLYNDKKLLFILMDVMFIISLLFNMGALAITNVLVVKNNPNIIFTEANAIQANINNFAYDPATLTGYFKAMSNIVLYSILIILYIFYRRYIFSELGFIALFLSVIMFMYGLGYDFFHDLFLLYGKWWF